MAPAPAIPLDDQIELEWYFAIGISRFSRSSFGPMIDRMLALGWASEPCPACDHGIRWDFEIRAHDWTDSAGHRHREIAWIDPETRRAYPTNECPRCRGTGVEGRPLRAQQPTRTGYRRCAQCHGVGEDEYGETCHFCGGRTYRVAPPAFRTCPPNGGGAAAPDDGNLQRMARVSRRLAEVRVAFEPSPLVLAALYSAAGLRWATRGRPLLALYPLTPSGARICSGASHEAGVLSRLESALTTTEVGVSHLVARALVESETLRRRTVEAWCVTRGARRQTTATTATSHPARR